jgi:hypothetical protein
MPDKKSLAAQIDEIRARLEEIEERLVSPTSERPTKDRVADRPRFCAVPEVPEREFGPDVSVERARLIRVIEKKWVNGTVLRYYFFEDPPWGAEEAQEDVVRAGFEKWEDLGIGIGFQEVASPEEAEIRIGFLQGDGAWSYVGRDILNQGQYERTMNFGWDLTDHPDEIDTAIHEIGHTLGFPHEHQNPFAGIVWDEEAVYEYFGGPPNYWPRDKTYWNVIRKIYPDTVEGTQWDPDSIMHYAFRAGLIVEPPEYQNGLYPEAGLSATDRAQVRLFYPPLDSPVYPEMRPFESHTLSLAPGQQKNFSVLPTVTRNYDFRTFGASDTVMVLFEEFNGELRYVTGDDDSGTALNASFRVWLTKGRKYVLRIRLYYQFSSGDTAVMMW